MKVTVVGSGNVGATVVLGQLNPGCTVSIHAPARGATRGLLERGVEDGFNSRAREGRDVLHGQ